MLVKARDIAIVMGALLILTFTGMIALQGTATAQAVDNVSLSSARDFLYASLPQGGVEDSVLVTAQVYSGGMLLKKAGIPVSFTLSDGRYATLDDNTVYTDAWGTASTRVRSHNSGLPLTGHPFNLAVRASAGGKSAEITLPVTAYRTLSGRVTDRNGSPVEGATVSLLYSRTGKPVKAAGATTTTDINGDYRLDRVPTDLGSVVVYARKGDRVTSTPADFPGTALRMR